MFMHIFAIIRLLSLVATLEKEIFLPETLQIRKFAFMFNISCKLQRVLKDLFMFILIMIINAFDCRKL